MLSPQRKIGLLLVGHIVVVLFLAFAGRQSGGDFVVGIVALISLMFADVGLVGIWGGVGLTRLAWRVPAVVAATAYVGTVPIAIVDGRVGTDLAFLGVLSLSALTTLVVVGGLRHSRLKLRLIEQANVSPPSKGFQFSIRHLLLATAIVATVLGLGQVVRAFAGEWQGSLLAAITLLCFALLQLAMLWASLGIGRPAPRLAVVAPASFMLGAIPVFYLRRHTQQKLAFVICIGLSAVITAASLLVVRSCGWRLAWGEGVQPEPQPLPDDQGSATAAASR